MKLVINFLGFFFFFFFFPHSFSSSEVEEKYEGPRLEEEVTKEFMKELIQWHKDEKKLHKKYAFKVCEGIELSSSACLGTMKQLGA